MSPRKIGLNLVVIVAPVALFTGIWALYSRPVSVPDWSECIFGFSLLSLRLNQNLQSGRCPSAEQMRVDLEPVVRHTHSTRIYPAQGALGDTPALAEAFGLRISSGIWLGPDLASNEAEVVRAIRIANEPPNVVRVVAGNEALFRREVAAEQLIAYLDRVRAAVKVPVTIIEQWHIYHEHPELARHVDLIAAHALPYWEVTPVADVVDFVLERVRELRAAFSRKPLLLAGIGWPSNGRMRGSVEATPADQAVYPRRLTNAFNGEGYGYLIIEALNQPWKVSAEGPVGAYWGAYNADRKAESNFIRSVVSTLKWRALAIVSVVLAVLAFTPLLIDSSPLRQHRRTFFAVVSLTCASVLAWIAYDYSQQYSTWFSLTVGVLLGVGALGVVIMLFTEAHELVEAVWMYKRRRPFLPITAVQACRPKVLIHVPCYSEPSELLEQTLDALARLDYLDYEVLVIDNNTRDPVVWQPVEAHCVHLGERFRFFHVASLKGLKVGALNFVLSHVAADVEVVAVINADYCVDPDWFRHMVLHFGDPQIAVVQSPQDYRGQRESAFKRLCYAKYKGFFHIGMVTRNDCDAIIEHGTMTMIRRSVLDGLRWPEWCITEDVELGLRVFKRGLSAVYFERSYDKGVVPDIFIDFKKQRFRWAHGAIQIMKQHTDALLCGRGPDSSRLTRDQHYRFVAG